LDFLLFPAAWIQVVAGPEETKNPAGRSPPPDSDPFSGMEFGKNRIGESSKLPQGRITNQTP
jgi:hypothetical protein